MPDASCLLKGQTEILLYYFSYTMSTVHELWMRWWVHLTGVSLAESGEGLQRKTPIPWVLTEGAQCRCVCSQAVSTWRCYTHYHNTLITQIHARTYIATQAGRHNSHSMHATLKYTDANMHRQIHTYVITPVQIYTLFTKHRSSACTWAPRDTQIT